jgi:hypothetical protein
LFVTKSYEGTDVIVRYNAVADFFTSMGLTAVLEERIPGTDIDTEIGIEMNILRQAIKQSLQAWALRFPELLPEDLIWPEDFYSDEREIIRNWLEDCMNEGQHVINSPTLCTAPSPAPSPLPRVSRLNISSRAEEAGTRH